MYSACYSIAMIFEIDLQNLRCLKVSNKPAVQAKKQSVLVLHLGANFFVYFLLKYLVLFSPEIKKIKFC